MEGAGNKVPKVALAAIQTLHLIIRTFGVKVVPLKPIMTHFLAWFEHTNADVRQAAQELTIELYKWVGGALLDKPVATLRQAQVTELQKAFADIVKGQAAPEKYLRCQVEQMQALAAAGGAGAGAAPVEEEIDAYSVAEAFPLMSKITSDQYELLQSKKWKDKKETLEAINKLADTPRLASGDYGELTKVLKKLLTDSNVFVVDETIHCLCLLAIGLRGEFTSTAKSTTALLLERFKERSAKLIGTLHACMDAYHPQCIALSDIQEDILTASKHKVAGVKKEMLSWLKRALPKEKRANLTKSLKFWCTLFMDLMDESDATVRENAFECFGLLVGMLGERQLTGYLNQMDKVKEKRVREFIPATPIPAPAGGVAAPGGASSSAPPAQVDINAGVNLDVKPAAKKSAAPAASSTSSASASKRAAAAPAAKASGIAQPVTRSKIPGAAPSSSSSAAAAAATTSAASSKPAPIETFSVEPRVSAPEAEARVMDLLGETVIAQLSDKNWQERVNAMSIIASTVERWDAATAQRWTEALLLFLVVARPSFKEPNVQVLLKVIEVVRVLCSGWQSTTVNKADVYVVLRGVLDKIGEAKLLSTSIDLLNTVAENPILGLQFAYNALFTLLKDAKVLKAQVEGIAWFSSSLAEFSAVAGPTVLIDHRNLVTFVKTVALESTNATIKATGIRVLCELSKQLSATAGGSAALLTLLPDVKPQLMTTIKKELEKGAHEKPAAAVRGPNAPPKEEGGDSEVASSAPASQSSADMPRVDISAQIAAAIPGFAHADWQKRQEAMASVESILLEVRKIQPKGISALMIPLKARLADSNINLIPLALNLLGEVAAASGPTIESHIKTVMPQILGCYANLKNTIRAACGNCLDKWVEEVGMDPILPYLPTALGTPSGRAELLAWISTKIHYVKKGDVKVLLKPAFQCYQDKTKEVRTVAETALIELARKLGGGKVVEQECSKLAPTVLTNVRTLLKANEAEIAKKHTPASMAPKSRIPIPSGASPSPSPSPRKPEPSSSATNGDANGSSGAGLNEAAANQNASSAPASAPAQSGPLLRNNKKEERELAEVAWIFDVAPTAKLIDILREQTSACVTPELLDYMFSSDAKSHSAGISDLERAIDGKHEQAVLDSLDVILKWISWRLLHPNAAIVKKVVGLLEHLIGTLDIWEHKMSDLEAESFLPLLVVRLPFMNESTQSSIRAILSTVETNFYAPSKIFKLFVSKYYRNWTGSQLQPQSKCEVLSYLATFIRRQTLSVCDPAEAFKALSSLLSNEIERSSERSSPEGDSQSLDSSVIIATLDVFLEAAKDLTENEALWSYIATEHHALVKAYIAAPTSETLRQFKIGTDQPKDDDHHPVDQHSNESASKANAQPAQSSASAAVDPFADRSKLDASVSASKPAPVLEKVTIAKSAKFTLDLEHLEVPVVTDEMAASILPSGIAPTALPASVTADPTPFLPSRHVSKTGDAASQQRAQAQASQAAQMVSSWTRQLKAAGSSADSPNLNEVLNEIHTALSQEFRAFAFHVEPIIPILLEMIRVHFDMVSAPTGAAASSARVALLGVLRSFYRDENTAQFVPEIHTRVILPTLIESMINAQSLQGEGETLITGINSLIIQALTHGNRTALMACLISILREKLVQFQSHSSTDAYTSQRHSNFIDVAMKCLMRLVKVIPSSMAKMSIPSILYEVHLFLASHPPHAILHGSKQSAVAGSVLEVVKALVDKLVETLGAPIINFIGGLPSTLPPSALLWYIKSSLLTHSPNIDSSVLQQIPASDSNPETASVALNEMARELPNGASVLPYVQPKPALSQPEYRLPVPSSEEMKQTALRHVFGKISKKETSSIGLLDLHWLLKDHADINLDTFLAPTSQAFKNFIHDQLKRLAAIERVAAANASELEIMTRDEISNAMTYAQEATAQLTRLRSLQAKLKIGKPSSTIVTGVELAPSVLSTMVSTNQPKAQQQSNLASNLGGSVNVPAALNNAPSSGTSSAASSFRERLRNVASTNDLPASVNASKFALPTLAPTTAPGLDFVSSNTGSASVSASSFALPTLSSGPAPTSTSPVPINQTSQPASNISLNSASITPSSSLSSVSSASSSMTASSAAARLAAITSGASLATAPVASVPVSQVPVSAPAPSVSSADAMRERLARIKGSSASS